MAEMLRDLEITLLHPVRSAAPGTVPREGETWVQKLMPSSRADYVIAESGCWIWQKYIDPKGYPQSGRGKAHHIYWSLANPAHVLPRGMVSEGQDDPLAVIPLGRPHHRAYDAEGLDILSALEPRFRKELAFAVQRAGLITTLRRVTNSRETE